MQNQTLKIEIPKGYEIDSFDKASGEIKFKAKPKDVMERIMTVADVLADNGFTAEEFDEQCEGLTPDEKSYRILKLLTKSLNEGWRPDWSNPEQYKYYPWLEHGSPCSQFYVDVYWDSFSFSYISYLCFKSKALADHVGKNFSAVYRKFMLME